MAEEKKVVAVLRVVQPRQDAKGQVTYRRVGTVYKATGQKVWGYLKIGELDLLLFKEEEQG